MKSHHMTIMKIIIVQYLGSIGIDNVIIESCYKGTIFQRNYRKMTIFMVIFL